MMKVGFIVEGKSEQKVYESEAFIELLGKYNLLCVGVISPGTRTKFFIEDQLFKYYKNILDKKPDRVFIIIDKENEDECLSDIKKKIVDFKDGIQINIIQVKTLESWFLADSEALSNAFKKKYQHKDPEKVEGHPYDVLQEEFLTNIGRGLGLKESTLPARKMVNKYNFSIENAAKHPNCPSAKYFLRKLSELNPN